MTYHWQKSRPKQFAGYGQAQWATQLQSGQLQPVRANFAPACAETPTTCAFNPNDLSTIYLTRATPNWGAPPGYRVGPQPSSWSWASNGPAPWPGVGPAPSLTPPAATVPPSTTPSDPSQIQQAMQATTTDPTQVLTTTTTTTTDSGSTMMIGGIIAGIALLVLVTVLMKKKKKAPVDYGYAPQAYAPQPYYPPA